MIELKHGCTEITLQIIELYEDDMVALEHGGDDAQRIINWVCDRIEIKKNIENDNELLSQLNILMEDKNYWSNFKENIEISLRAWLMDHKIAVNDKANENINELIVRISEAVKHTYNNAIKTLSEQIGPNDFSETYEHLLTKLHIKTKEDIANDLIWKKNDEEQKMLLSNFIFADNKTEDRDPNRLKALIDDNRLEPLIKTVSNSNKLSKTTGSNVSGNLIEKNVVNDDTWEKNNQDQRNLLKNLKF